MRDFLKRNRRIGVSWLLPLLLLALPTCTMDFDQFQTGGEGKGDGFDPGPEPLSSAVMCDIPQLPPDSLDFQCASQSDIAIGMPDSQAAVALNLGDGNSVMLDYSDASFNQCGAGNPRRIDFFNDFPAGTAICLNCASQIPSKYADPNAVCVAKCVELIGTTGGLSPGQIDNFCANAHVSTNFDKNACYDNFCTTGGMPMSPDPRVNPENVTWVDTTSTVNGNNLTFPGPAAPAGAFDGGAATDEIIAGGDAWVEFAAGELGVTHVIGVRTSCDKAANCPDGDDTLTDIPLVINLNVDGHTNIVENGVVLFTDAHDYALNDRYRIHVTDRHDGTANISFTRFTDGSCPAGSPCTETPVYTYAGTPPSYPLQIDTTFREAPASLVNVTIMRIKQ